MNNIFYNTELWKKCDYKKRLMLKNNESYNLVSKIFLDIKLFKNHKIFTSKNYLSKISIRNKCLLTGSSKNVLTEFKLSRLNFRILALKGFLPGIRKSVW